MALPLGQVAAFLDGVHVGLDRLDQPYGSIHVAHPGDRNLPFLLFPKQRDDAPHDTP